MISSHTQINLYSFCFLHKFAFFFVERLQQIIAAITHIYENFMWHFARDTQLAVSILLLFPNDLNNDEKCLWQVFEERVIGYYAKKICVIRHQSFFTVFRCLLYAKIREFWPEIYLALLSVVSHGFSMAQKGNM